MTEQLQATLDGIRERLSEVEQPTYTSNAFGYLITSDVPRMLAALEAVMELHKPEWRQYFSSGPSEHDGYLCLECIRDAETEGATEWPCPTVQAIAKHLVDL